MGISIHAFVEYDDGHLYLGHDPSEPPFSKPTDQVISFTDYVALSHGKDYDFIAAISGFRNRFGIPPLYRPRGLPPGVNRQVREYMDRFFEGNWVGLGWLMLSEI